MRYEKAPQQSNVGVEYEKEEMHSKERLLALLPSGLRARWTDAPVSEILNVLKHREAFGYEKIIGFHVSNKDLNIGSELKPDMSGEVYYSTDIGNLYGRHGGGFIYVVEGTAHDGVINDELGWRTTKGKMKIVDKISITDESMQELGASFAEVEYH